MGQEFPQATRLKTSPEFQLVFDEGRKTVGRYFVLFVRSGGNRRPRLGLAIGRRVGNAIRRNRLKRLVRESFRTNQERLIGREIVVVARSSAARASNTQLVQDLSRCWERIADD